MTNFLGTAGSDSFQFGADAVGPVIVKNDVTGAVTRLNGLTGNDHVDFILGGADDQFGATLGTEPAGLAINIDGGSGNDTVSVLTAASSIDIAASASDVRFDVSGGAVLTARSTETVNLSVQTETLNIGDLSGTSIETIDVKLLGSATEIHVSGSSGADLISGYSDVSSPFAQLGLYNYGTGQFIQFTNFNNSVATPLVLDLGAGDDMFAGTSLALRFNTTVFGGAGNDKYVVDSAVAGGFRIADFAVHAGSANGDVIEVISNVDHSFADLVAHGHLVQVGSDVQVTGGANVMVTLQGVALSSLTAADFLFPTFP